MAAPLLALSVPLMDASLAIARRFLRQKPIFGPDRGHIHHQLLSRGLTPRRVVFVLYGFCGLAAASALLLTETHERYHSFIIVLVCLVALYGLRHLGYAEFSIAWRLALKGSFRRQLNEQLTLIDLERQLSTCATLAQCPEVLYSACSHFGFSGIDVYLDGLVFHRATTPGWHVRIDFPEHGYINLTRDPGSASRSTAAVRFIDSVHRVIDYKLNELKSKESEFATYAHAD
jgi:UDP-GlcNAc:undecaprenyl-phosphate GlcNAc-1-phosphate transferase